jgi:hypothetical protein
MEEMLKQGKVRLMTELKGKFSPQQIKAELDALKVEYTLEGHERVRRLLEESWAQKQVEPA